MSDDRDARTTRLILVPGTWGRGFFQRAIEPEVVASEESTTAGAADDKRRARLRWFEPGSVFREQLGSNLRDSNIPFATRILMWDGHNSIVSRNKAAIVLADLIRSLANASNEPIVVIAHSHGGNVALRAVHIAGEDAIANLKVVTLATPFLQIHDHTRFGKAKWDGPLSTLRISLMAILGLLAASPLLYLAFEHPNAVNDLARPIGFINPLIVVMLTAVAVMMFVGFRLADLVIKLVVNPEPAQSANPSREDSLDGWVNRPKRLASLSSYALPQTTDDWLLVLRGVDDEASLSLAAGAIGNTVTRFILEKMVPHAFNILAVSGTLAGAVSAAGWSSSSSLVPIIVLGFAGAAFVPAVILVLPGLFRLVFGRELMLGCWRCEIAANSSPDGGDGVRITTLLGPAELSERKLRHSLYTNPEVSRCIGEWLRAKNPR